MKKKALFLPIFIVGFVYFLLNLISCFKLKDSMVIPYPHDILMSALTLFGYIVFVSSLVLYFLTKWKYAVAVVYIACLVFAVLFFAQEIVHYSYSLPYLNNTINSQLKLLENFTNNEYSIIESIQASIKNLQDSAFVAVLHIVAASIFLAGSVVSFGSLSIRQFCRARHVNAESILEDKYN